MTVLIKLRRRYRNQGSGGKSIKGKPSGEGRRKVKGQHGSVTVLPKGTRDGEEVMEFILLAAFLAMFGFGYLCGRYIRLSDAEEQ